ncbi:hypothetical protein EDD16DRAFT_1738029 [Pisolithus croceorrhizus]|nr:hypothetical protein EDD16DRAFT_1738029 [Pisolithus croceorrhizus]KAI6124910.1 hypothetical protein EV401DRAFT_2068631 [Pisolithus croceorrhizus]
MPPSSSPPPPATGSKPSELKVSDQASTSATYQIDIVQRVRVTSDGPLESDAIDQIKKKLERSLQRDLSGYSSSDESSNAKISITETSVNVLRKGRRDRTLSSSASFPASPSRALAPKPGSRLVTAAARHQSPSQEPTSKRAPQRILFYHAHDPYYGFTNFSSDPVEYHGTSHHCPILNFSPYDLLSRGVLGEQNTSVQFLPHRPELAEHMRTCSKRPRAVFDEAHRFSPEVRPDWLKVRIEMMDVALWHKFTQNTHLKDELLSTGDAELVEDSDKDAFWGVGPDGKGGNQLGKALQRLRTKLRDANTANGHGGSKADSSKTMHRQ